jgi:acetyl-CoA/propionyl-CoA carboxylase, biotin carboxylase, biotin carboxyl carrier protein
MLVKPEFGGGGKGMQRVDRAEDLSTAVAAARRVSRSSFASDRVFVERYVERARHVEVQILADTHGDARHVFERECSLQRRHQKVVEESPCPALNDAERKAICDSGASFAAGIGYVGAGTVEFLFDPVRREHYFLEMNTRLQVEHPVTEMVCGVDLVAAQLRIARGEALASIAPFGDGVSQRGHSIEARVYAEDPAAGYLPQVGLLSRCRWPAGPFVRVDTGYQEGDEVGMHYDPMLAKVIAWGADRDAAIRRLKAALQSTVIHGVVTNLPMLLAILDDPEVIAGSICTSTLDDKYGSEAPGMVEKPANTTLLAVEIANSQRGAAPLTTSTADNSPWSTLGAFRLGGGK